MVGTRGGCGRIEIYIYMYVYICVRTYIYTGKEASVVGRAGKKRSTGRRGRSVEKDRKGWDEERGWQKDGK